MGIAEAGNGFAPVLVVAISAALLARYLLAILDQTRTKRAADNFRIQNLEPIGSGHSAFIVVRWRDWFRGVDTTDRDGCHCSLRINPKGSVAKDAVKADPVRRDKSARLRCSVPSCGTRRCREWEGITALGFRPRVRDGRVGANLSENG